MLEEKKKYLSPQMLCRSWRSRAKNMKARSPKLEALGALQLQLNSVSERDGRDYVGFRGKNLQRRKSHLVPSNIIIQGIACFWAKAMFVMVSDQDEDLLSYMINLKVQELSDPWFRCKL
ncbi:hypothetical protein Celaphus_00007419, partial [Cervus elaphus hippelaphus]